MNSNDFTVYRLFDYVHIKKMISDIEIISKTLDDPKYENCTIDYYPCITKYHNTCGSINIDVNTFKKMNNIVSKKYNDITSLQTNEYLFREKKLILCDDTREYVQNQQMFHHIEHGLIIITKQERIEPNKFPFVTKYTNIEKKDCTIYNLRHIQIVFVHEIPDIYYLKISFEYHMTIKKNILKNLNDIISLFSDVII